MATRFEAPGAVPPFPGRPRWFRLLSVLPLALILWRASAVAEPVAREAALLNLANQVIATGYQDLAAKCRELTNAATMLAQAPDQNSLAQAQKAWAAAMAAANRVRCIQMGPVVDREYAVTFYYSRVSPQAIDGATHSSNAINQAYMDTQSGDLKGMFALEYLLFAHNGMDGSNAPVLQSLLGKDSAPRRAYLLAAACDVERKASQLAQDWTQPGPQGAAAKFAAGGQTSVNLLVNQLAHAIEDAGATHLNLPLVLPKPISRQLYRIEGSASGTSLENLAAYLDGARRLYCGAGGPGLSDVLKDVNAPLAAHIQEQFDSAISAVRVIGEPLERAVVDRRATVQSALDKTRALEILCKTDLASALGVTITFTSGDGD